MTRTILELAEDYKTTMVWHPGTSEDVKNLVLGNINGFAGFLAPILAPRNKMQNALEDIQTMCCYLEEDASANPSELLIAIRRKATEGLGEEWKG